MAIQNSKGRRVSNVRHSPPQPKRREIFAEKPSGVGLLRAAVDRTSAQIRAAATRAAIPANRRTLQWQEDEDSDSRREQSLRDATAATRNRVSWPRSSGGTPTPPEVTVISKEPKRNPSHISISSGDESDSSVLSIETMPPRSLCVQEQPGRLSANATKRPSQLQTIRKEPSVQRQKLSHDEHPVKRRALPWPRQSPGGPALVAEPREGS